MLPSGSDLSLDDLSEKRRKKFMQAVASGKLSHFLKPWEPWWLKPAANRLSLSDQGSRLVQTLDMSENQMSVESLDSDEITPNEIPAGPENPLPSIRQLTSTEPSPLLAVHLVEVIYSYCFTLRFFNGDWKSDPLDAAMVCLSLSSVLGQQALPETVSGALSKCLETACSPSFKHAGGFKFAIGLFDDVASLLRLGRAALLCALMDLYRLLEAAMKDVKGDSLKKRGMLRKKQNSNIEAKRQGIRKDECRKTLQFASRKVYFLMSWTNEQPSDVWSSLTAFTEAEKNNFPANDWGNPVKINVEVDNHKKAKPNILIEEISKS